MQLCKKQEKLHYMLLSHLE